MKTSILLLLTILLPASAHAMTERWTDVDGRTMYAELVDYQDAHCIFKKQGRTYRVHNQRLDRESRTRVGVILAWWEYQYVLSKDPSKDFHNSSTRKKRWEEQVKVAKREYNEVVAYYNEVVEEIRYSNMTDSELRSEMARLKKEVQNSRRKGGMVHVSGSDGLYYVRPLN